MEKFKGVITALVTPFIHQEVDYVSLKKLVEFQIKNGVDGFVISGTTGESPNLSQEEKFKIYRFVREIVGKDFPLILGTGSNSTKSSIDFSREAQKWGVDALLLVAPYYNKPPQRGLIQHFTQISKSVSIPSIIYNVPGRTVISIEPQTIIELSQIQEIIGVKEASGKIDIVPDLRQKCRPGFILLSGDDPTYPTFMKKGGDGVISVVSHIIPEETKKWLNPSDDSDQLFFKYQTLVNAMGLEANPIPVKMALYLMGIISSPELRLPLVSLREDCIVKLNNEMKKLELF